MIEPSRPDARALGKAGGSGCVRGGTERVRANVRDGGRLAGRSGGGARCRSPRITSCAGCDETASNLPGDSELAAGKRPRPRDRITRTAVPGRFRLEHSHHPLRTVRSPCGDDAPVGLAQCLRRAHAPRVHVVRPKGLRTAPR